MIKIYYASAPCGGGKTRALVRRAIRMAKSGRTVLILQPTVELIEKTIREHLKGELDAPLFFPFSSSRGCKEKGVGVRIIEHLRGADVQEGQIIFATHQALEYIPFGTLKGNIDLIIDENIQVIRSDSHKLRHSRMLITDEVVLEPYNAIYSRLRAKCPATFAKRSGRDNGDDMMEAVRRMTSVIASECWDAFVNTEHYSRLLHADDKHSLTCFSLLKPSMLAGFKSVLITAANFEESDMYKLWSQRHAYFVADTNLLKDLRYSQHDIGHLISIYYVTDDDWSKTLGEKKVGELTVLDLMCRASLKLFGDANFLWQANKSVKNDALGGKGVRLPNMPHGLNDYSTVNNVVFLSALNPTPEDCRFRESVGLSASDVRRSIYYEAAYQSVMRTSARSVDYNKPITIMVPDRGLAEYLLGLFPGATATWLNAGIAIDGNRRHGGRKRKYANGSERGKAERARNAERRLEPIRSLMSSRLQHDSKFNCVSDDMDGHVETSLEHTGPNYTGVFHGSFFNHIKNDAAAACFIGGSVEHFALQLHNFHLTHKASKDHDLISPSMFDKDLSQETNRGKANIVYCRHIWLDFEKGHLHPEEFPKLFPTVKMIVTNTKHHTKEAPRFRVIIPTSRTMSADEYEAVIDSIKWKLEDAGYLIDKPKGPTNRPLSGLDKSKLSPSSLFSLPSQADVSSESFFEVCEDDDRVVLDPSTWIGNAPVQFEDVPQVRVSTDDREISGAVQKAILEWRQTPKGDGNDAFFHLGLQLMLAGLSEADIRATLETEASYAKSLGDRRAQIKSIIKSLHRYNLAQPRGLSLNA